MSEIAAAYTSKKHGLRIGYVLVALLLVMALLGPWLAPYDSTLVNLDDRLLPASASHCWVPTIWGATYSRASSSERNCPWAA